MNSTGDRCNTRLHHRGVIPLAPRISCPEPPGYGALARMIPPYRFRISPVTIDIPGSLLHLLSQGCQAVLQILLQYRWFRAGITAGIIGPGFIARDASDSASRHKPVTPLLHEQATSPFFRVSLLSREAW